MMMPAAHLTRLPYPSVPDSWYAIAWSHEVPNETAVPLEACGEQLVAFRNAEGQVHVLDAYCPHLGAHLGHGGTVVEGQLRCPFHGWRFSGDGKCTLAPGARTLSDRKSLRHWLVQELHGRIWIWYSSVGAEPSWSLPTTLLDPTKRWSSAGHIDRTFSSHPQEIMENAVDPAHFEFIHGMLEVTDATTIYEDHCVVTKLNARSSSDRLGVKGFTFSGEIVVRVYGMGLQTIYSLWKLEKWGVRLPIEALVIEGVTPRATGTTSLLIDTQMARVPIALPGVDWIAKRSFLRAVIEDVDADVQVWANRRYLPRPQLTAADLEIGPYRRWARRFYPAAANESYAEVPNQAEA